MKVLYMSGYAEPVVAAEAGLPPGAAYLDKPFTLDALVGKVRELLDRARAT